MKRTTSITIYHKVGANYVRKVYHKCFWDEDKAANIKKSGLASVDSLYVSMPLSIAPNLTISNGNDLVIQGEIADEFDNTSQQTQSNSLKTLKEMYQVFTISAHSKKDHGSPRMHHWEISGK